MDGRKEPAGPPLKQVCQASSLPGSPTPPTPQGAFHRQLRINVPSSPGPLSSPSGRMIWLAGGGDETPLRPPNRRLEVNKTELTAAKKERDRQRQRKEKKEKSSHTSHGDHALLGCPGNYGLCPLVLSGLILMQILFLSKAPFV